MLTVLAIALAAQETPQEQPKLTRPDGTVTWIVEAGSELGYDSNILRYSNEDVDQIDDGTRPDKYRLDEPDDIIFSPWAELSLKARVLERPTTFGLRLQPHLFQTNSVASYEEYALSARTGLFRFEYEVIPEIYRRDYRVPATGLFDSAFYTQHRFELGARPQLAEWLTLRPETAIRIRDYESPFDYRDSLAWILAAKATARATPWLDAELGYEFTLNNAYADSGEPDTSYLEHGFEPGVVVRPSEIVEFGLAYLIAFRRYTTNNDPAVDPSHRGRDDDIRRLTLSSRVKVSGRVSMEGEIRRTRVDSDRPSDPGATGEETSWRRAEYVFGFTCRF